MNLYSGLIFLLYIFSKFVTLKGFGLLYRTISVAQKSCTSTGPYSYSCCENVIIFYTHTEKSLCVNFMYQRNGLNVDITLDSNTIKMTTVTNYRPFKYCVYVPGCLFSTACVNILELNRFPRSITACLRLDIYAKKKLWQINYDCISISTDLPMMSNTTSTAQMASMTTTRATMMTSNAATTASMAMMTTRMATTVTSTTRAATTARSTMAATTAATTRAMG